MFNSFVPNVYVYHSNTNKKLKSIRVQKRRLFAPAEPPKKRKMSLGFYYKIKLKNKDFMNKQHKGTAVFIPKKKRTGLLKKLLKLKSEETMRLKLVNDTEALYTFQFTKKKQYSIKKDLVDLEESFIENPKKLENGFLIEVKYEEKDADGSTVGSPYVMRYIKMYDVNENMLEAVTEYDKIEEWSFNTKEDDWSYPKYELLNEEDVIHAYFAYDPRKPKVDYEKPDDDPTQHIKLEFQANGWEKLRVVEKKDDYSYKCVRTKDNPKWQDPTKGNKNERYAKDWDNHIDVDVRLNVLKYVEDKLPEGVEQEKAQEYIPDEEEQSDDDQAYIDGQTEFYRGKKYTLQFVIVDDNHDQNDNGEYLYDLTTHKGEKIRVNETDLENDWNPEFQVGTNIRFEEKRRTITGFDYDNKKYILDNLLDKMVNLTTQLQFPFLNYPPSSPGQNPIHKDDRLFGDQRIDNKDISVEEPMEYSKGDTVMYDWDIYVIQSLNMFRRKYVLQSESSKATVKEKDLNNYYLDKRDNTIWIWVSRTSGGKEKLEGKKIPNSSKRVFRKIAQNSFEINFVDQRDVHKYLNREHFQDLRNLIEFKKGEKVVYDDPSDSKDIIVTIIRMVPSDKTSGDDIVYEIQVGDERKKVVASLLSAVDEEKQVDWQVGELQFDNGKLWQVSKKTLTQVFWKELHGKDGDTKQSYSDKTRIEKFSYRFKKDEWHQEDADSVSDSDSDDDSDSDEVSDAVDRYVHYGESNLIYFCTFDTETKKYKLEKSDETIELDKDKFPEDIIFYTPEFETGYVYDENFNKCKIVEVKGDGTYEIGDINGKEGTVEQSSLRTVEESSLRLYVKPLEGFVKIVGEDEIYKVIEFKKGKYTLQNIETEVQKIEPDMNKVDTFENDLNDDEIVYVESDGGKIYGKVAYDELAATYKMGRKIYYRHQLKVADPMLQKGADVVIKDGNVNGKITNVDEITREYKVKKDGGETIAVGEDGLREARAGELKEEQDSDNEGSSSEDEQEG